MPKMPDNKSSLPRFKKEPLVETILGVQFDPLEKLDIFQFGKLRSVFEEDFPEAKIQSRLEPVFETFGMGGGLGGAPQIRLVPMALPQSPRCWFLDKSGNRLLQIQDDRFLHNWRKVDEGDPYPHYDKIRKLFKDQLKAFRQFVEQEDLGPWQPNQCEITYVNHIQSGEKWQTHGELYRVLNFCRPPAADSFLQTPEDGSLVLRYQIPGQNGNPIGRLHIDIKPAFNKKENNSPLFVLELTARGKPVDNGNGNIDSIMTFLDIGREWIVKGFDSITTDEMHKNWEKEA